jgi:hypothetical protein
VGTLGMAIRGLGMGLAFLALLGAVQDWNTFRAPIPIRRSSAPVMTMGSTDDAPDNRAASLGVSVTNGGCLVRRGFR